MTESTPNQVTAAPDTRPRPNRARAPISALVGRVARALKAEGEALWVAGTGEGERLRRVHERGWTKPSGLTAEDWARLISRAVSRCATQRVPVAGADQRPGSGAEAAGLLFAPIVSEGRLLGVAGFQGGRAMTEAWRAHGDILGESLGLALAAAMTAPARKAGAAARPKAGADGAASTGFATALLAARGVPATARAAADGWRGWLGARRVVVFERRGAGWRPLAISNVEALDRHAPEAKRLATIFGECAAGRAPAGWFGATLDRWCADEPARHVGVLVEAEPAGVDEAVLRASASLAAHALHGRRPWWRPAAAGEAAARRRARLVAGGLILLAVGVLAWPSKRVFAGECELVPARRSAAAAEHGGRIAEVLVAEGERVTAGQALFRLDTGELEARLDVARQILIKAEAEARRRQNERDLAALRAARIERDRARADATRLEEDVRRATVTAAFDGVVVTPDVGSRRGGVVQAGEVVCEVAALDVWDLAVKVPESDVGRLEAALREQPAGLPVRYVLQARADLPLFARVDGPGRIGQMALAEAGGGPARFLVTVPAVELPEELRAELHPGFSGVAKIEGGRRPWVAGAFERLLDFVRLRVLL